MDKAKKNNNDDDVQQSQQLFAVKSFFAAAEQGRAMRKEGFSKGNQRHCHTWWVRP